jgi:hypothetical protein
MDAHAHPTGIRLPDGLSVSFLRIARAVRRGAIPGACQVGAERGVAPNRRGAGHTRRASIARRFRRGFIQRLESRSHPTGRSRVAAHVVQIFALAWVGGDRHATYATEDRRQLK